MMSNTPDYLQTNQALWNKMTSAHLESDFYALEAFKRGQSSLNQPEIDLLGDIRGKKILHLQCHFGQDSLSLARMGAEVTGIDLSDQAIEQARILANELQLDARFIQSDVLSLDQKLEDTFDIVFTSYGVIGWLPDLEPWGKIINHFLKPAGKFVMVEFHQMVWMFDSQFEKVKYGYFNDQPYVEEIETTYADDNAPINKLSYQWNHSISDVVTALIAQDLKLKHLKEYDYSVYDCFDRSKLIAVDGGYQIRGMEGKLPMMFSTVAQKQAK